VSVAASESPQVVLLQEGILQDLAGGVAIGDFSVAAYARYVKSSRLVARELQLSPGEQALIVNGRVGVLFTCSREVRY
jgi:UDP-glucose:glycoprotein glucosyltransferase